MSRVYNKTKFIAEVCSNHNGNLKRALKFVDFAKELGFYAVKFQMFEINKLYSKDAQKLFKNAVKKRKRELPRHFIQKIYEHCKKRKIKFSCTPFDISAVKFLKKYVDFYKIASYEMSWPNLLKECAKTKKQIILSTGMANLREVKKAVKILKINNCKKFSLLHCVSSYPADIKSCNLNSIDFLRKKFNCEVGWSDHTVNELLVYSAIKNHKASFVELHVDIDGKGWENVSGNHCWMPKQLEKLMTFTKEEKKVDGNFGKNFSFEEKKERKFRTDPGDGLRPLRLFRHKL